MMWTDTFQTIVMFGSFLAVIIKGNNDIGGARRVFDTNYQKGRIEFFKYVFAFYLKCWITIFCDNLGIPESGKN